MHFVIFLLSLTDEVNLVSKVGIVVELFGQETRANFFDHCNFKDLWEVLESCIRD